MMLGSLIRAQVRVSATLFLIQLPAYAPENGTTAIHMGKLPGFIWNEVPGSWLQLGPALAVVAFD